MKAVLNETKRILAVMLSVAMIIAAVPQVAFASETVSNDETPVVSEEATEAPTEEASESPTESVQESVEGDSEEEIVQKDAGNEVAEEDVVTDEEKDATSRGMTIDGNPASLASLKYGDEPGNVTLTAKQTVNGSTTTYTGATLKLYKLNTDAYTWGDNTGNAAAALAAAQTAFGNYSTTRTAYIGANMAEGAEKTAYEAAQTAIETTNAEYMTEVASGSNILDGLKVTIANGVVTFSTDSYIKETHDSYYVVKYSDDGADKAPENLTVYSTPFEIKAQGVWDGAVATVSPEASAAGKTVGTNAAVDNGVQLVNTTRTKDYAIGALGDISFNNADQNFTVYKTLDDAKAAKGSSENGTSKDVVVAEKIAITAAGLSSTKALSNVTWALTDKDGTENTDFEILEDTERAASLYNNSPINLYVAPKSTLTSQGASKAYTAYLHIYHTTAWAIDDEYVVRLNITVGNDLALTVADGELPEVGITSNTLGLLDRAAAGDNEKAYATAQAGADYAAGGKYNPYVIASRHIGEEIKGEDSIIFKTSGGSGNITWTVDSVGATNISKDGLRTDFSTKTNPGTLTMTGTLKQDSFVDFETAATGLLAKALADTGDAAGDVTKLKNAITAHEFKVTAKDAGDSTVEKYFIVETKPVDEDSIVIGIKDDLGLKYGKNATMNVYDWTAPKGTKEEKVGDFPKTIEIYNGTNTKLVYNYTNTAGSSKNGFNAAPANKLEIEPDTVAELVLTPLTRSDGNPWEATVNFTGVGMATTGIKADFDISSQDLDITTPRADNYILPDGMVGVTYEKDGAPSTGGFEFHYVAPETTNFTGWTLTGVNENVTWTDSDLDGIGTVTSHGTTLTPVSKLTSDYGLTFAGGVLYGTPKKEGKLELTVQANYVGASPAPTRTVLLEIGKPDVETGILVTETKSGTNVSATEKVNMGSVDMDATTGADSTFAILNQTEVEMTGVKATLDANLVSYTDTKGQKFSPTGTASNFFKIVYDENDPVKDANLATSGLSIKKNATGTFKLVSKPSASMHAGTYVAEVEISSTASLDDSLVFTATLVVVDKPVLSVANMGTEGADGKYTGALTVGSAVPANAKFTVNYATSSKLTWEYAVKLNGEAVTLGTPDEKTGLTFTTNLTDKKLDVSGTLKKAGDMVVEVTATSGAISTSKTFTFVVAGTQNVAVTIDASAAVANKTYVLASNQVGDTPVPSTIYIKNQETTAATNLDITVEDAPDDRQTAERVKTPGNPYNGSSEAIDITKPSPSASIGAKDTTNDTATAVITPKTTTAGEYKVKVTVTGDKVIPVSFYVYSIVYDPLTLVAPSNPVAEVGVDTHYEIIAQNAPADSIVTFTQVKGDTTTTKNVPEDDNKKLIANANGIGFAGTSTVNYTATLDADYGGTKEHIHEFVISDTGVAASNVLDKNNKIKGIEIADFKDSSPKNAGAYTVYLKGEIAAANFDGTKHYSDGVNADIATNYLNTTNALAKREAWTSFTLTVNKSSAVKVKNVTSGTSETAIKYDIDTGWGSDTDRSGIVANEVKSYTVKPAAKAANYNSSAVHAGIYNGSTEDIVVTLTRNNTDFTIGNGNLAIADATENANGTVTGTGVTGNPYTVTLAAGKTTYVEIIPVATLAVGTHTCAITVAGKNMEGTKTLNVSFEVQKVNSLIDVDYVSETVGPLVQNTSYQGFLDSRDKKPVDIARANTATSKVVELTPFKEGAAAENHDVLFVRNTGNSAIATNKVSVEEVLNAAGDEITSSNDYKLVTIAGDDATSATTGAKTLGALALPTYDANGEILTYGDLWVAVKPNGEADLKAGADYNAYLKFTVDGDEPASFVVPVHFVVYSKSVSTVSHTPTSNSITLEVDEGYDYKQVTGGEIVVKNDGTVGDDKNDLHKLNIVLSDKANFMIVPATADDEENIGYDNINDVFTIDTIKSGKSASFKVVPAPGLKWGDYSTTVTVTGGNLATSVKINKNVALTVNKSTNYSMNVYSSKAGVSPDADFAQRLYTSLKQVTGLAAVKTSLTNPAVIAGNATFTDVATGGNHHVDVYLDLDGNTYADTHVQFIADATITTAADVDEVYVERQDGSGNEVEMAKFSYDMTIPAPTGTDNYFSKLTFNEYSTVALEMTENKWIVNEDYDTFEEKNENIFTVGKKVTLAGDYKGKITGDNTNSDKAFVITVKNGSSAGSVFTAKKLPTPVYVDGSLSFEGWQVNGGLGSITDSTAVRKDITYEPSYHEHEYPGDTVGDTADGSVKWTWNADHSQAQVTIKCISTDPACPDANKGAITLTSEKGQITITPSEEKADCTQGTRKQFKAQTISSAMPNGAVYTDTVATGEDKSTILGHDYKTTINWVEKADGSYAPVITQVCVRPGCTDKDHKKSYTVPATSIVVTEQVNKAATCLKTGETVYTITSFVDGNGKTVSGETLAAIQDYTYTATIKAKGHDYKFEVEWNDDHKTAKSAKLVCKVCEESETGHTVDVLELVTYDPKTDASGKLESNTATVVYGDKTYTDEWVDDILYNPVVTWSKFPVSVTKGGEIPQITYTVTVTSKKKGTTQTTDSIIAPVTVSGDFAAGSTAAEVTFTASADLSKYFVDAEGKLPAQGQKTSQKYTFPNNGPIGYAKEYTYKSHKFEWQKQITLPGKPAVTATVTYKVTQDGAAQPDETLPATVAVSDGTVGGKYTAFTATLTDINGGTQTDTQKYDAKGKLVEGGSGDSPSEPEEQAESGAAQNLFYTDVELSIPGFASSGAETTGTGKWTQYYSVGSDGTVTVKPTDAKTRKTAANASNSLIVLPIKEDGVQVGELHYALPVYYAKPSLKLSSTKGTIKKGVDGQSVKTKVSEKKSNGAYEPLDLSDQKEGIDLYAPKKSEAVNVSEISTDGSEITIPATGKTTGKIQVQLANWCDKVELNYTVAESNKDVLTVDKKTVYMNTTANAEGEAQIVTLLINGRDVTSEDGIKVTYPNNFDQKNIEIGGVTEDRTVEGSEITVAYKTDAAPVKGNYTLKFVKGTSKASVKISVSKLDPKTANKAVTTKIQTKMNLTTGQKMVLIPQLKGIGGEISEVKLDSTSEELFDIDYNEEVGQIYLWPKDVTKVNTTTQYKPEITITVGGVECKAQPKFKPQATKPTVKIDKVTLDKNKVKTATDGSTGINAAANVLCTYKLGGKTFTIDPIEEGGVEFYEGNTKLTANAGVYTLKNGATFSLEYDKSEGILKLTDYQQSQGKGATVKVHLMFPGQTKAIVKNFSIKTK